MKIISFIVFFLQGFGESDYDYYDDTDPVITTQPATSGLQSKIPVELPKRPQGPGFGGPADFGETNSEVRLFAYNLIVNNQKEIKSIHCWKKFKMM